MLVTNGKQGMLECSPFNFGKEIRQFLIRSQGVAFFVLVRSGTARGVGRG